MIIHKAGDSHIGEVCWICKEPSSHKVEEDIPQEEYLLSLELNTLIPPRHPFTTRLCCEHFWMIMGISAQKYCEYLSVQHPLTNAPNML